MSSEETQNKKKRRGPRPLNAHLGMAASCWPYAFAHEAVAQNAMPQDMQKMLRGIQLYQDHDYERKAQPLEPVWKAGTATLSVIPGHAYKKDLPTIVLVPSLINKAYILDLMPERSMLRFLAGQGINPYILDWGLPCDDPGQADMDGVILERLVPALEYVQQEQGGGIHALGYCMGGTLLMGAAAHLEKPLASAVLLASPWDFHGGSQALLNRVKFWTPTALPAIADKTALAVDWMQMIFASLDPASSVRKFARFTKMDPQSEDAHIFIAVEDWLNDGVDLPSGLARTCVQEWFLENQPSEGTWKIGDREIIPSEMPMSVFVIASRRDRLVEYETAVPVAERMKNPEILDPSCGHIGMIAGASAVNKVWQPIADWLHEQA